MTAKQTRQRLLLCNSFINMQQYWNRCWQAARAQQWKYCWKQCFLWHIDPLLGNDLETNETTAIAVQQLHKYATVLEPLRASGLRATMEILLEAMFSTGPLQGYITRQTKLS
jgi:hypothetical protein